MPSMKSRPKKSETLTAATDRASSEVSQTTKKGTIVSNSTALTIAGVTVRQLNGLFSLNDLHRAAGGEAKHQPALFMRMEQTQALIAEIGNSTDSQSFKTKEGRNGGTYACRELVIAYAAWINAAFHLKVIRVFLAVTAPQTAPYTVQPGDTLNEAQQIALRAMLESNVKRLPMGRRGEAMRQGWSKLKSHFKVPYRQIPASEFEEALSIIARHVAQWELVDESTQPAIQSQAALQLPRLDLHMQPPPVGTYRYNPANPYPRNGRTIEVAKSIALDILNWSDHLPTAQARQDLHDAAQTLHDLLVSGWTEVDEALSKMHTAMHFLNRWQGRGGTVGNCQ